MSISKIKNWSASHKIISAIIAVLAIIIIYWSYGKIFGGSTQTKYVIAAVEKGTIVTSVSGSGQVSASNQVTLQSKVSGDIVYVGAKVGDRLGAGALIAQVDSQDARIALENAQIALKKLIQPADQIDIDKAQNTLIDAQASSRKAYDDGFSNVTSAFVDFPTILSGLKDLVQGVGGSGFLNEQKYLSEETERNYAIKAASSYYLAKNSYDKSFALYKTVSRTSDQNSIKSLIDNVNETAKKITQAVKDAQSAANFIQTDQDIVTTDSTTAISNLSSWLSKANSDLQSLTSSYNSISSSERTISEQTASLSDLKNGSADPLDVRSQELNVQQKQSAYNDSFVRAPFAGVVAALDVSQGDSVSNGTAIGTFITEKKVADISLNEVDVAKVKAGQKVTLTFDAIDDLTIAGQVIQVDLVGTVSGGVVSYNVKIAFDTEDSRIRSGMSANASIIVDSKQDVLVVPSGAIKNQNGTSYVEVVDKSIAVSADNQGSVLSTLPTQQIVQTGVTDDTSTEIISGLGEGDKIVTKTVTSSATSQGNSTTLLSRLFSRGTNQRTSSTSSSKSSTKTSTSASSEGSGAGGPPPGF
jgi:HlyD family secretion protein